MKYKIYLIIYTDFLRASGIERAWLRLQGRSDGGIWVYIPPKSVHVNFLWVDR